VLFEGLFGVLFRTLLFGALFGVLPRDGGVNGRKPSFDLGLFAFELSLGDGELIGRSTARLALFEFAGVSGRFPVVAGPRASRGEMAGAWYGAPAALAGTAAWKSAGLAVAATGGRPWFTRANSSRL
jgi:hypothetical protein